MIRKNENRERIRIITISIGLFLIAVPLDTVQLFGGMSILRIIALIPLTLSIFYEKKLKIQKSMFFLILFILYVFIQIFYSENASATIKNFITLFMYMILLFFTTSIEYNTREKCFLERLFAYSTIVTIILAISRPYYYGGRLTIAVIPGQLEDQNQLCGYFIVGIIYFLRNIKEKQNIIISFCIIAMSIYYAILTGSRGGILSILLAVLIFLLLYSDNKEMFIKRIVTIFVVIIMLYLGINYTLKTISPELADRFSINSLQESGGSGRAEIWDYYFYKYNNSPSIQKIFGCGMGAMPNVAHNNWIQLLIETGIFGEILYIALIISFVKTAYKKNNIYLFSVLIGYIGLTMSLSLFSYKPMWGVMMLILIKYHNEDEREVLSIGT